MFWGFAVTLEFDRTAVPLWEVRLTELPLCCEVPCEAFCEWVVWEVPCWRVVVAWLVVPDDWRAVALEDCVADEEAAVELPLRTVEPDEDVVVEPCLEVEAEAVVLPLRTGVEEDDCVDVVLVGAVVVLTVVRPLLVTFELETVVSFRSTEARPDWEDPVVVVLAPEDAARTVVADRDDEVVDEPPRTGVWALSGTAATSRKAQAAAMDALRNIVIFIKTSQNKKNSRIV